MRCASALLLPGAAAVLVRAADSETPSVFRPTLRELSPAPAPAAAPRGVAARFELSPGGDIALKVQPAAGPEETVASWDRDLGGSPTAVPAAAAFPDGTLVVAYRRPTATGSALVVGQRVDGQWQRPKTLAEEPAPGPNRSGTQPVIARSGARAVIAWYSEAGGEPQVLAATSPDAGGIFVQAERIDLGRPAGGVGLVVLHDGTQLVSWVERPGDDASQPGGLYLRRTTAYGTTLPPALLLRDNQFRPGSVPRLAVVTDEPGAPVQLQVTYAPAGQALATKALHVTLPDPAVLADADRGCGCAPTAAEAAGVTIRARVISSAFAEKPVVRLRHNAVPGLLRAGETDFAASRQVAADVRAGLEVLAHLDEVDGTWTLLDYRVLAVPPAPPGK